MISLPSYVRELRLEVRELRIEKSRLIRSARIQWEKAEKLIRDISRLRRENTRLRQEQNRLRKENEILEKEIEKLTKTNNRYQVALFDHGNFRQKGEQTARKKGGQPGHTDTNREAHESTSNYPRQRLYATVCAHCGRSLKRTRGIREKTLMDIVINPQAVKLILETERQWCPKCRKEVSVKHPGSLPFTEYGLNVFMIILLLRFRCQMSFKNISTIIEIGYGLFLSKSTIASLLFAAKAYLKGKYDELIKAVREGTIMYNDETGWLVHGQPAWLWVMATYDTTVYQAAEGRGNLRAQVDGSLPCSSNHHKRTPGSEGEASNYL